MSGAVRAEEDARRDAWKDAMAMLRAALDGDDEGGRVIYQSCDPALVVGSLGAALIAALDAGGLDPRAWIAAELERARAELA